MNREKLIQLLKKHEGLRLKPYKDSVGKLTIGVGRNLSDVGIFEEEAEMMLMNDIDRCIDDLDYHIPWWDSIDEIRQMVLVDMCFNLGIFGLLGFKNTLESIKFGNYEKASQQMLDSKWAIQVGNRAKELSEMMRGGR
jgi:lysozyme